MSPRVSPLVRDFHLYVGLFLSPFVLLFAISVVFLVHAWLPGAAAKPATRAATEISLPADFEKLKGREQLAATHGVLDRLGVRGEITALRQIPRDRRFVIAVSLPGHETTVDLNVIQRSAAISSRTTGIWDATVFLHKMPGPHNASLRGNSFYLQAWRWLADATVYLLLFVSVSGIYLWAVLKTERRIGLSLLAAGAATFGGLIYALV